MVVVVVVVGAIVEVVLQLGVNPRKHQVPAPLLQLEPESRVVLICAVPEVKIWLEFPLGRE